jgi:hypothetical protein
VFRQDALAAVGGDDRAGLRDGPVAHVAGQPSRRRRDDALLDAIPDAAGLALQRPGQLGDLHHGPEIGGDRGFGVLELPVVIEESAPEHLVERVEVVAPAVAAEVAGVLGALPGIGGDAAAGVAAAVGAEAAGGAGRPGVGTCPKDSRFRRRGPARRAVLATRLAVT